TSAGDALTSLKARRSRSMRRQARAATSRMTAVLGAAVLVLLGACGAPTAPEKEVIVPDTTVELDQAARASLVDVAADGTLRFALDGAPGAGAALRELEPGDVVVSQPTDAAP